MFRSSCPTTPVEISASKTWRRRLSWTPRLALTVHSRPDGISGLVDQYASVITEPDKRPIRPLQLLLHTNNDGMTNITTADFTGERSGGGGFGACRSLLLDDDDYPVTYIPSHNVSLDSQFPSCCASCWVQVPWRLTDCRGPLLLQDVHALDDRGAGVVDAT